MGDPAGIGPEVTLAALAAPAVTRAARPILVGERRLFEETARRLGRTLPLQPWQPGAPLPGGAVAVLEVGRLAARERRPGKATPAGGRLAYAAIVAAASLVRDGFADALTTAPISKANLAAAGCGATGHTELLAEIAGGAEVRMMMIGSRLRVALATTHLALADVPAALDRRLVADTIRIADGALRTHFGLRRPRIAVTGLNPHAGEQGLYGREEIDSIRPAIDAAKRRGVAVSGPLAADSAFPLALRGDFDAVVCMYHDQALAPFKLLHFSDGVNFTAGLPFVRTSPDHGTAYDIAGRGRADPTSMKAAIRMAARCAPDAPRAAKRGAAARGRAGGR
jgi:4-hydroxythreonine-4-phosphate dehydrogenase